MATRADPEQRAPDESSARPWLSLEDRIKRADDRRASICQAELHDDELDEGEEPPSAPRSRFNRAHWFGLKSPEVPSEAARDFCMRERTYMAWSKFYTYMTILSCTMFLDLRLQDEDEQQDTLVQTMRALLPTDSSVPPPAIAHQAPYALSTPAVRLVDPFEDKIGREDLALGVIYLIAAFLSYIVSTQDYFACVRQLEAEHTYLDECEGHSHPIVTILSCVVGLMITATVLLMIVQREDV